MDAVLNLGLPAPIDVQVGGSNMEQSYATALKLAAGIRRIPNVADAFIPQDIDYPRCCNWMWTACGRANWAWTSARWWIT